MNTRLNITIPTEIVNKIRRITPKRGVSRFLAKAAEEKVKELDKKKALEELLNLPPAFPHIKDSAKWVRNLRRRDLKRMKRLGI